MAVGVLNVEIRTKRVEVVLTAVWPHHVTRKTAESVADSSPRLLVLNCCKNSRLYLTRLFLFLLHHGISASQISVLFLCSRKSRLREMVVSLPEAELEPRDIIHLGRPSPRPASVSSTVSFRGYLAYKAADYSGVIPFTQTPITIRTLQCLFTAGLSLEISTPQRRKLLSLRRSQRSTQCYLSSMSWSSSSKSTRSLSL